MPSHLKDSLLPSLNIIQVVFFCFTYIGNGENDDDEDDDDDDDDLNDRGWHGNA